MEVIGRGGLMEVIEDSREKEEEKQRQK